MINDNLTEFLSQSTTSLNKLQQTSSTRPPWRRSMRKRRANSDSELPLLSDYVSSHGINDDSAIDLLSDYRIGNFFILFIPIEENAGFVIKRSVFSLVKKRSSVFTSKYCKIGKKLHQDYHKKTKKFEKKSKKKENYFLSFRIKSCYNGSITDVY